MNWVGYSDDVSNYQHNKMGPAAIIAKYPKTNSWV
jgi:hypothetical protein